MKKWLLLLLGLILIVILSYFCFLTKTSTIQNDLVSKTQTEYEKQAIEGINIKNSGNNLNATRILILTGTVLTVDEKNRAMNIAKNIEGVTGVDNQIVINTELIETPPPYKTFSINKERDEKLKTEEKSNIENKTIIEQGEELNLSLLTNPISTESIEITTIVKEEEAEGNRTISEERQENQTVAISCQKQFKELLSENKINFIHNQTDIKSSSYALLEQLIETSKSCPNAQIIIEGHTDSEGKRQYNQILSEKRANAVKSYLIEKGISQNRLSTIGHGEIIPIATNNTSEGRKINRRIEFNIKGVKQ